MLIRVRTGVRFTNQHFVVCSVSGQLSSVVQSQRAASAGLGMCGGKLGYTAVKLPTVYVHVDCLINRSLADAQINDRLCAKVFDAEYSIPDAS